MIDGDKNKKSKFTEIGKSLALKIERDLSAAKSFEIFQLVLSLFIELEGRSAAEVKYTLWHLYFGQMFFFSIWTNISSFISLNFLTNVLESTSGESFLIRMNISTLMPGIVTVSPLHDGPYLSSNDVIVQIM